MINALLLILSLFAGSCAGALFFEGLWRTVSRAAVSARPVPVLVFSFAIRAILLLGAAWLVSQGNPLRLTAFMLGFLAGRVVILHIHRGGKKLAN